MKKSIFKKIGGLFLGLAMGLGVAVGVTAGNKASEVKAVASPYYLTPDATQSGNKSTSYVTSAYSFTYDDIGWTFNQWNPSSLQIKTNQNSAGSEFYFNNTTAFPGKITKVTITFKALTVSNAGGLCFLGGTSVQTGTSGGTAGTWDSSAKTLTWTPASTTSYTYFKFYQNGKCASGTNNLAASNAIKVEYQSGFDVSYNKNLPTGASESDLANWPSNVKGQSSYTIPSTKPSLPGYKFDGYATGASEAVSKQPGDSITATTTLYGKWTPKTSVALSADDLDLDLQNDAGGVSPLNPSHSGVTYVVDDESVATYSSGKFYPQAVGDTLVTMTKDEDDNNVYEDGMFVITVTSSVSSYAVTWTNTNAIVTGSDVIYDGEPETYTITAASGYKLPDTVSVSGATGSYSKTAFNAATLTISEATGPVSFSVAGIALANYGITFTGDNYTHTAITQIQEFGNETITLTAAEHYDLPNDVTVINATKVSYTKSNGQLVISNPTGAVTINVDPVVRAHYTISVSGAGDYKSHFSYSGHENGIYATESTQVTIAPDTSTDDTYVLSLSDISVTGATKDSYTNNVLTISNPKNNVTITVTPRLRTINGIVLITEPTTKTYDIGQSFSTSGAVVKLSFNDGTQSTENIINQCDIIFDNNNPSAMFEEGSHTVKFVYNGMSTISTNITVKKVTHDGTVTFAKTNITTITTGKLLIAAKDSNNAWYYLPTASASNAGPVKTSLTIKNGLPEFANTVAASTYMWNFTVSSGGYTIKNDSGEYLYANNSNSGLRVGSTSDTWTATATTNGYKLQETNNSRFLGVWVDGSDWRPYTSANAANYKGTGENIVFFTRTENPGTHLYAGIVAELPAGAQYYAGQTVEKSDLVVTGYYDDGEAFEVDSSDCEISGNVLSLGLNTITVTYQGKTSAIKVNALQRSGTLIDARIETSAGWKQNYFYDGEQLEWDFTNINLVAYYDDEHTVSVSLQGLVESEKVEVSPEYPTHETTSFTITGSYDDGEVEVDINEEYNTVDGITVTDRAISSLSSWNPSSKFSFTVYEEAKFDFDNIGSVNLVWNDGTPATGAQQIKPLIEDGRLEIGLFKWEDYSAAASIDFEPEIVVDSSFTWDLDYNGYFMALSSPLTRTRKQVQFEVLATPDSCTAYINSTATVYDGSPTASKYYNNMSVTVSSTDSTDVKDLISVSEVSGSRLYASPNTSYFCIGGNATTGGSITLRVKSGYYVTSVSMVLFNGSDTAGHTFKVNNESFTYNTKSAEQNITAYTYSNSIKLESLTRRTWVKNIFITMEKASAAAETYATRFNAANVCGTDDYTAAIGSVWEEQAAYYSNADIEVRNAIKNGVADQTGSTQLEQCLARYDAAVSKASLHGTTSTITDFMSRNPSNGARINSILALDEVDNSVWVISAVALVGLTAIGGYFFYRKRKENF